MRRTIVLVCLLVWGVGMPATPALALSLDFVPVTQAVSLQESVAVDIVLSDLPAEAIGTFDLDVTFDPTRLLGTAITFGPFLGDPDLGEALTSASFDPVAGVADLAALSLLPLEDLLALQGDPLLLGTLSFIALAPGTVQLAFSQVIVDDAFGIKLDPSVGEGIVTVVPLPATVLLLGFGLTVLGCRFYTRRTDA